MKTDLAVKIKEWVHRIFLAKWLKSSLNLLTTHLPQSYSILNLILLSLSGTLLQNSLQKPPT